MLLALLWACHGAESTPRPVDDTTHDPTHDTATTIETTAPLGFALAFDGEPPSNVLMISIDTFRRDKLSRYGGAGLTPFLDQLIEESVVADDHIQCSNWTWHSTSCTLNGRYAEDIGHLPTLASGAPRLPDNLRTLARILSEEHGYATSLASANRWLGPIPNNSQGYLSFNPPGLASAREIVQRAKRGTDAVLPGSPPWFAHGHVLEAHPPYNPPEEYRVGIDEIEPLPFSIDSQGAHYLASNAWPNLTIEEQELLLQHLTIRYEGEIRWIDAQLSEAFAEMDADGTLDDTLVVVWTDHGEAFWEHDVQTHAHHLYSEENDAVAFFWAKNIKPQAVKTPTHAIDIVPTILTVLGIEPDADMPGIPLGLAPRDRTTFISTDTREGLILGAVQDKWKLLYHVDEDRMELFRRTDDRVEANDWLLDDAGQDIADALWEELEPRVRLAEAARFP